MKRLLIVDDNPGILEVLKIGFEVRDYDVLTTSDGNQVLQLVKEYLPDVILLDVFLDSVNGIIICTNLKTDPETKHIPVVMFCATSDEEVILNNCPADAFVGKPFKLQNLITAVESQLSKK